MNDAASTRETRKIGLETIELIMRAEEEFAIEIPGEDAEQAATCGALRDVVS